MNEDDHIVVELPGARAAFTTRFGGVSTGPYESLNLGILTPDDREAVIENRERVQRRAGARFAFGMQVHGSMVRSVSEATDLDAALIEADGIVTASVGVAPMVLAADCLPVAIAGGGAVAIVHAGWQGLASGVIAAAVGLLRAQSRPEAELGAAIGPGAGPCCYEVGEELHERFAALGQDRRRGQNLDLKAIAHAQLTDAGITSIEDLGLCTICDPDRRFFSHRRDHGVTGRQAGVVWLI